MCTTIEQQPCKLAGMAGAASSAPYRTVPRVLLMQKRALTGGKARTNSGRQSICSGAPALRLWRCCSALAWSHMPGRRTPHRAARSGGPCPCTCTNRLRSARLAWACLSARQSARMADDRRLQRACPRTVACQNTAAAPSGRCGSPCTCKACTNSLCSVRPARNGRLQPAYRPCSSPPLHRVARVERGPSCDLTVVNAVW